VIGGKILRLVALGVMMVTIVLATSGETAYASLQVLRRPMIYVKDANSQTPIAGASVSLDGVSTGTTDSSGTLTLGAYTGQHQLTVGKDGYNSYSATINIQPSNNTFTVYMSPDGLGQESSYTIFIDSTDGNKIKAKEDATGNIAFVGGDPAAVLQSAIDALASTGGSILLSAGTYVWQSVPALPKDLPNWLKIVGQGTVTIQLTASGPRAFDFHRTADYDTFREISIENLIIDCNNVGGKHHVVLGTYQDGYELRRIDIQDIIIRNVITRNVPVDPTGNNHRLNIHLMVYHPAPGERQTSITNILIENCNFSGGNEGIAIGGAGPSATGLNIFIDNVNILNCSHSMLSAQASSFTSANFHIGSRGFGGYAHIANSYGEYSGDVGVEINAVNALVENTVIVDAALVAFYHTNYNQPQIANEQQVTFRGCVARKINLGPNLAGLGFKAEANLAVALGALVLDSCSFYSGLSSFRQGEAIAVKPSSGMAGLSVKQFRAVVEGVNKNTAGSDRVTLIYLQVTGGTVPASLKDIDLLIRGSRASGAGSLSVVGIDLEGSATIDVDNVSVDFDVAGTSNYAMRAIQLGETPSTLSGTISRLKVVQMLTDTNPYGVMLYGAATLTIIDQLRIEYCDFGAMTNGIEILIPNDNMDKVYLYSNILRTS